MFIDREQAAEEFFLYLDHFSPLHKGEQTLEEFINSDQLFIPAKRSPDREFQILNTQSIIYIKEKSMAEEFPGAAIRVFLRNGQDMRNQNVRTPAGLSFPAHRFFQHPRTFLPFIHEQIKIYINKNHIVRAGEK